MSKARRLKKMRKIAQGRPRFFEGIHEGLLEAVAWAKGEISTHDGDDGDYSDDPDAVYLGRGGRMSRATDSYKIAKPELQRAVWDGDTHGVTTALSDGADPNALAAYGDPMLVVASSRGHLAIVEALLAHGADPNLSVQNGPALLQAIRHGHPLVANALLRAEAVFGWHHAEQAALCDHVSLLNLFLEGGVYVNQRGVNGDTLLMSAAFGGHTQSVQTLLDTGADVNMTNGNGWTALHSAAACGHTEVVKLLLSLGASASVADRGGDTPLTMAVKEGHGVAVALLKAAGTWG